MVNGAVDGMRCKDLQALLQKRTKLIFAHFSERLSKLSVSDFARLVETFDQHECSFVSVTQAFNTSTSMGRLTLNVLLSFAQFEREVTAERIRDKIAASKKKGIWMGGLVPLGYDVEQIEGGRRLIINEVEAATVRRLFELMKEAGNLGEAARRAKREGHVSKLRHRNDGSLTFGGKPLSRGQLAHLAPDIQRAILRDQLPATLTLEDFVRTDVPVCWTEQRKQFGFSS